MHNFRKLQIWIDGMNLVDDIYNATDKFPKHELFGLASQMQRSATSVPSNIAEGSGKSSNKDFARFLSISVGSLFELETQVLIAERRGYIDSSQSQDLQNKIIRLEKMINTFKEKLDPSSMPPQVFL
ncbi:MAG: four helix bundle protein [Paludibacteraceae bacterium]|nr:four helix bundle protein [Paludibacteraceae bacterium]